MTLAIGLPLIVILALREVLAARGGTAPARNWNVAIIPLLLILVAVLAGQLWTVLTG